MNETHINLHKNGIKNIARDAFKGLFKTEIIRLSENQIENIEEKTFDARELLSLAEIYLSYNKLTKIEKNLLYGLDKLTKIDLSKNKIQHLPDLSMLRSLTILDVTENALTEIPALPLVGCLKILCLGSNFFFNLILSKYQNCNKQTFKVQLFLIALNLSLYCIHCCRFQ